MMITGAAFPVEPWRVRETELDVDQLPQTESIFALSNGHIGLRGNLDEGEPSGLPGAYLAGFCELLPVPYAEPAYGYPESSQTVVNVTDAKIMRLLVDDEPFDVRYGALRSHERCLDLRAGVLERAVEWTSPSGASVRVHSTRMVSLSQRAVVAVRYEVEPLDRPVRVVVQSELFANEELPQPEDDPRAGSVAAASQLTARFGDGDDTGGRAVLVHTTDSSQLRVAVAMEHEVSGPDGVRCELQRSDDVARATFTAQVEPGTPLVIVKYAAYGWSGVRSTPALRDQVWAALTQARQSGWAGLVEEQRAELDRFWSRGDVEIEGDPQLQQAIRFALFHVLQAGLRGEQRAIPAKGLTGSGYDGQTFWDNETYVLPVLTYTLPRAAADALRWRRQTLDLARERARQLHLDGAAFPWRTIQGQECSGYWPAGTAAFHINADIAAAVVRLVAATGDATFEAEVGLEILVETARLWRSLGHYDHAGGFRLDGVTGPDEYSALADNNVYTNLMARHNLREAVAAADRRPEATARLGVDDEELAGWRQAAEAMVIPYDAERGLHPQSEGFFEHDRFPFDELGEDDYPLMFSRTHFDLYRKQVVKQADLVMALYLCGDAFTPEQKRANFAYYEPLTVRDSSLSACIQAVMAAEVGHLELAYAYFREAALMDLGDLEHNVSDGLHIASLAGTWIAAVAGFGGMRDHGGRLAFAPRLPQAITRLAFRLYFRGVVLRVQIDPDQVTYSLDDGQTVTISHHGEPVELSGHASVTCPIPPLEDPGPEPEQPPWRSPRRGD